MDFICDLTAKTRSGSLGVPRIPILERFGIASRKLREYSFEDTTVDPSVEFAFQALALDESRASFSPAVWEKSSKSNTVWLIVEQKALLLI